MVPPGAFALAFTAAASDIDELGHVNNAVWVQWIQHLSVSHWASVATLAEQAAFVWVIVRHEVDYRRPLLEGGAVTGHTWVPDPPRGARFDRHLRFLGGDGTVHVEAITTWAMLDRASGRPSRVPAVLTQRFGAPSHRT